VNTRRGVSEKEIGGYLKIREMAVRGADPSAVPAGLQTRGTE
jgi:hypothetical protein